MDVFQFLDPYLVMQSYYQDRKKYEAEFSYSIWCEELGLKSSSTLRMMVNRKKRLSDGVAEKFAQRVFRTSEETSYFRFLLLYAHAQTPYERNMAWSALAEILAKRIQQEEAADFFTYISDLMAPKITTLLTFEDTTWDENSLADVLNADVVEIRLLLQKLMNAGMVKQVTSPQGEISWRSTQRLVKVSDRHGEVALKAYHNASLDEAKLAQDLPFEVRRYKSLLLPLTDTELVDLRDQIDTFTRQLIAKFQSDHYQERRLYKVNLNFFPVSQKIESK